MSKEHILVKLGWERYNAPKENQVHFVEDETANTFLNDFKRYPHAYVLACCMDRQMKAEAAWMIPYKVFQIFGDFSMKTLASKSETEYVKVFRKYKLHRFTDNMGKVFYDAIQRIHHNYADDANNIWKGNPSSATVVYRFLEFNGVGIKIATMATNILARQYKIPFSDNYSIDVSPDVHVRRVMCRMGLVEKKASNDKIIYKARELCPEFPGIIDYSLWLLGRTTCKAGNPDCENCLVKKECAQCK
jgi:endonuclease III